MIEKGSKLKAKCPHCDIGCEKCSEGYTEVTFGTKDSVMYSLICRDCGSNVGGGLLDSETRRIVEILDLGKRAICPFCDTMNIERIIEE
jgi:hypothetical protein